MGFFDFVTDMEAYNKPFRLNTRHDHIIAPYVDEIEGARVYDMAAHDGRWSYAFAGAGAREVVAVEARSELVERYDQFPESDFKDRVHLEVGDLYDHIFDQARAGERYDIVAFFGIYYHVMDHFFLLRQAVAMKPKLILIDSEFVEGGPRIVMNRERTSRNINAAEQIEGQEFGVVGIPSRRAMELMAKALNYSCTWYDWEAAVPKGKRAPVADYYNAEGRKRHTAILRPLID